LTGVALLPPVVPPALARKLEKIGKAEGVDFIEAKPIKIVTKPIPPARWRG
jgi:hypothetical protein